MSKLIFGCGYLGRRIAEQWRHTGDEVHVVTRSHERGADLQIAGFQPLQADVTQPDTLRDLPAAETVLYAVGFDRSSGASIADVYAGGVRNVLSLLPESVQRFIYISTTGVYGPAGGDWVDEDTSPNPQRPGGRASLAAEQELAAHPLGKRSIILRLGGIYGPGRIPYLSQLQAGEPVAAPSEGWLNLIHVDDAAAIVLAADTWLASESRETGPHIFCVTDGRPVVRGNYYREVARLIGAPAPQFAEPDSASPAAARASADKRVCSDKLMQSIGVRLAFPSYREGLAAILAE